MVVRGGDGCWRQDDDHDVLPPRSGGRARPRACTRVLHRPVDKAPGAPSGGRRSARPGDRPAGVRVHRRRSRDIRKRARRARPSAGRDPCNSTGDWHGRYGPRRGDAIRVGRSRKGRSARRRNRRARGGRGSPAQMLSRRRPRFPRTPASTPNRRAYHHDPGGGRSGTTRRRRLRVLGWSRARARDGDALGHAERADTDPCRWRDRDRRLRRRGRPCLDRRLFHHQSWRRRRRRKRYGHLPRRHRF